MSDLSVTAKFYLRLSLKDAMERMAKNIAGCDMFLEKKDGAYKYGESTVNYYKEDQSMLAKAEKELRKVFEEMG